MDLSRFLLFIIFETMLKNTLIALLLIFPLRVLSQKKLTDQDDGSAVLYAHIFLNNTFHTYSDNNGEFTIDKKQKFDTLKIVHLSYETRLVAFNEFERLTTIPLKEKATVLNEITITSKRKAKKKQILSPDRAARDYIDNGHDIRLIFETANSMDDDNDSIHIARAVYVPNNKHKKAFITKIILNSVDKETEGDTKYIPFKVNLMTYDTLKKLPGKKIFAEDLAVGKKKGQTVVIDLSKEELVELPAEGICIMVSVYSTRHYNNNGFNPPRFDAVILKKNSGFREYCTYKWQPWEEQFYSRTREQCFNFGIEIEEFE